MRNVMRSIMGLVAGGAMVLGVGPARADVSVTLRPRASVGEGAGGAITVADIADLDPPTTQEATAIAEIVIVPAGGNAAKTASVSITQVRQAMDAAKVNWGKTTLRGSTCVLGAATNTGDARAASGTTKATLTPLTPQVVDVGADGAQTIRQAICARLVELYNVDAADLRLAFEGNEDAFLDQTIWRADMDRRVDVQPMGSGTSVRTPISLAIYEGDRIALTKMVAVQALINRTVVTARAPIVRGQVIGSETVETGRQWMGPNAKMPLLPDAAIGQIACRGIAAGAVLSAADVTAPVVCKTGDTVWVHALSGPFTVKAKCRAQGPARDGELVQLKMDGSKQVFTARMSGPGRAVMMTTDDATEAAETKQLKPKARAAASHH